MTSFILSGIENSRAIRRKKSESSENYFKNVFLMIHFRHKSPKKPGRVLDCECSAMKNCFHFNYRLFSSMLNKWAANKKGPLHTYLHGYCLINKHMICVLCEDKDCFMPKIISRLGDLNPFKKTSVICGCNFDTFVTICYKSFRSFWQVRWSHWRIVCLLNN